MKTIFVAIACTMLSACSSLGTPLNATTRAQIYDGAIHNYPTMTAYPAMAVRH